MKEKNKTIPSDFVIIGGTGNLSKSKILPALFWRYLDNQIDEKSKIILCDKKISSKNKLYLYSKLIVKRQSIKKLVIKINGMNLLKL